MKRYLVLVLMAVTSAAYSQNVVYDPNAEVREVAAFTGIEVSGTIALYLSQGTTQGVAVSAGDEKYNSKIKTEVTNGVLRISVDGGLWNGFSLTNKKLKAYVTVTQLTSLEVSGASSATLAGALKSSNLRLEISGASELNGSLEVDKLNMTTSGASEANLSGTVKEGIIEASGASELSGYNLRFDICKINASGASDIRLTVNNTLNVEASGASNIRYKGSPTTKMLNSTGGSTIKFRSED